VAARDYWSRDPIRRFLAERVFLALLIDRMPASGEEAAAAGKRAVAQMLEALSTGASLILFPEGTRGKGDALGTFRSGIFHLCRAKPGLEVVPVHIENLNRVLPKGEFLPVPMLSRISFGVPFRLEDGEIKDAFLTRARKKIEELSAA
jgi:1-acyl-sn-glycerol-3-phosphate acyltransferase